MEPGPPVIAKKKCNIVRIVFFMLMMKRGKLAGKTLGNLMFHHYSNLSCRSNDVQLSFVAPREYEFSCSNSSAYPFHFPVHVNKRKGHHHFYSSHHHHRDQDEIDAVNAVQKVFEMLNNDAVSVEASPLVNLPGFGKSPMVRQLRITDSPFPLRPSEEDSHVDKAAEEFIERFYKDLRQQKRMAALEASYHDTWSPLG